MRWGDAAKSLTYYEVLYTDRQHAALGVEPADTTLPGMGRM